MYEGCVLEVARPAVFEQAFGPSLPSSLTYSGRIMLSAAEHVPSETEALQLRWALKVQGPATGGTGRWISSARTAHAREARSVFLGRVDETEASVTGPKNPWP